MLGFSLLGLGLGLLFLDVRFQGLPYTTKPSTMDTTIINWALEYYTLILFLKGTIMK